MTLSLLSNSCQTERKVRPASIRLHRSWNDHRCYLGGHVTAHTMATLNVATMAENKAALWRPCPPACCSAVSNPCTMTRLFMHAVKQDTMHLLFTAVAHCVVQIAKMVIKLWRLKMTTMN